MLELVEIDRYLGCVCNNMSGPVRQEQVSGRDSTDLTRSHVQNLRSLAERVEEGRGMFRPDTLDEYPEFDDATRDAIASLLRAKADKLEAHMDAIDTAMSSEFNDLVKAVEWCSSGDYGSGKVAEAWEEYDK